MQYQYIKPWIKPNNYMGDEFPDYYVGLGQSRDSDILTRSNFRVMLEKLGGESKTVIVTHCSHWACGWVKQILVHKSAKAKLRILESLYNQMENYCVLDDFDYCDLENEELDSTFEYYKDQLIETVEKHLNVETLVKEHATAFVWDAFRHSASYGGHDNAWVEPNSAAWRSFLDSYEFQQLLEEKNTVAIAVKNKRPQLKLVSA